MKGVNMFTNEHVKQISERNILWNEYIQEIKNNIPTNSVYEEWEKGIINGKSNIH